MIETSLPSPGIGGKGHHLRRIATNAISALEISAPAYDGGRNPQVYTLANFFLSASDFALADGLKTTLAAFATPTATFSIAAGATAGPVLDKGVSTGAVSYSSDTTAKATVDSSGNVTGVATGTSWINATIAAASVSGQVYRARTIRYLATVVA